jgi:hypothetical protein
MERAKGFESSLQVPHQSQLAECERDRSEHANSNLEQFGEVPSRSTRKLAQILVARFGCFVCERGPCWSRHAKSCSAIVGMQLSGWKVNPGRRIDRAL